MGHGLDTPASLDFASPRAAEGSTTWKVLNKEITVTGCYRYAQQEQVAPHLGPILFPELKTRLGEDCYLLHPTQV